MWINRVMFQQQQEQLKMLAESVVFERLGASRMSGRTTELMAQKAKDDLTIDWLRHRVNALEKEKAILLGKVTGVAFPAPEIVPTLPAVGDSYDSLPSFEDVGDQRAKQLGITHDDEGNLIYTK